MSTKNAEARPSGGAEKQGNRASGAMAAKILLDKISAPLQLFLYCVFFLAVNMQLYQEEDKTETSSEVTFEAR